MVYTLFYKGTLGARGIKHNIKYDILSQIEGETHVLKTFTQLYNGKCN